MRAVSITHEVRIAAPTATVWEVIADPTLQERLDPRVQLVSVSGDWRSVGAEVAFRARGVRVRQVVTEADPGATWAGRLEHWGPAEMHQRGDLVAEGGDTLLRWTVSVRALPLTRFLAKRSCEREVPKWLEAVRRESLTRVR